LPADAALVFWIEAPALGECWGCVVRRAGPPHWQRITGSAKGGDWGPDDLGRLARLYNALHDPDGPGPAERSRLLNAVRAQCLAPLEKHLGAAGILPTARRLLVVAVGSMALVPVEALADRYAVSYVPSGSVFARLRELHRPLKPTALVAVGDPTFDAPAKPTLVRRSTGHSALPGTRLEVEALAGLVGKGRTTLLVGSRASEQELDRLAAAGTLGKARIVHLATHGEFDVQQPERSRIVLAQDNLPDPEEQARTGGRVYTGELTVAAIRARWKLDADLVVLSACRSGLGRMTAGEGPVGFAHAFLSRGARSVVLTRWKVDDTASALLMVRFYENLLGSRKGTKPLGRAVALDEARRWLRALPRKDAEGLAAHLDRGTLRGTVVPLKPPGTARRTELPEGDRPFAHPFFWAAFVLVGDPD
jgi:CHAT domain-containing protein